MTGVKFIMPKLWEVDGKLYEVTLNETEIHHSPIGNSPLDYIRRSLSFKPVESLIEEK